MRVGVCLCVCVCEAQSGVCVCVCVRPRVVCICVSGINLCSYLKSLKKRNSQWQHKSTDTKNILEILLNPLCCRLLSACASVPYSTHKHQHKPTQIFSKMYMCTHRHNKDTHTHTHMLYSIHSCTHTLHMCSHRHAQRYPTHTSSHTQTHT